MQEFSRTPPLHTVDLSELITAVRYHSSYFSDLSLRASIEQAVFEGRGSVLDVTEIEENEYRSFSIEQSEALEKIKSVCSSTMSRCGIEVELRGGGLEGVIWSPGTPEFFISNSNAFSSYVEAIALQSDAITDTQESSLLALVDSLLCQMREVYRVNDPDDECALSFIAALPYVRNSIEILARAKSSFLPVYEELTVLQWAFGHGCAAEILSCSRAGGYPMQALFINDGNLYLNHNHERYLPACALWHRYAEDADVFVRKWRNLEGKLKQLLSLPELTGFTRSVASNLQSILHHAKLDIVPNTSCLDAPHADTDFLGAIDDIYDRLPSLIRDI